MIARLPAKVYRITRPQFARTVAEALSGEGGLYDSGRWHSIGQRILYTAQTSSLSQMERLAHADECFTEMRPDRILLPIALPDVSFSRITEAQLAGKEPDWRDEGSLFCRALGDAWIDRGMTCALIVPSAVNTHEANILFNPRHPEHAALLAANRDMVAEPLHPDPRFAPLVEARRRAAGA